MKIQLLEKGLLKALLPVACMIALSAFTGLVQAQSGFKGTVINSAGDPLPHVYLKLKETGKEITTDLNGQYSFENLDPGSYTLLVSLIGYNDLQQSVEVISGEMKTLDITLTEDNTVLATFGVDGRKKEGYYEDEISNSLRVKTPPLEMPQNIQVITAKSIQDQQSIDMLENVSRNVSGVQMIEHWNNFARINMRGFNVPAFRNGMNVAMPWGPLTEDMSLVERIEFVKGPAGFMLSSGEPGGFYNVVTKTPVHNQQNEVSLTTGSFNLLRATADVGGKVTKDGKLLYRLNTMGLTKGAHRDYEFNNRFTLAPSLKYDFNEKTSLTAAYIYQYSQMSVVGAAYVFSPNGYGDLDRDFTLAEPNIDPTNINEHDMFLTLNHKINKNWELTAKIAYLHHKQIGSSLWPESLDSAGNMIRGIGIWDAINESKLGQVFINGEVTTGPVRHRILTGLDIGQKDYYADWFQGGALGDTFNIYNPVYGVPSDSFPTFDRSQSIRKRAIGSYPALVGQRYASVYAQDELGFFKNKVRLTLAGRYTYYTGWQYGGTTEDHAFSPRVGLSVSIDENTTVYGLYDQSFIPQSGANADGEAFVPVRANDIEGGIKRQWFNDKWHSSLTFFRITKDNVITADPDNPMFSVQLGQVRSQGIEFDVRGEIVKGLNLILNYANTNVEVTKDTDEDIVGDRVAGHARHITNGWLKYRFSSTAFKGFGISLGYQFQVDRSSWNWGADNESELPDYFRLDGAISWEKDNLGIALNINNLLNEYLYSGSAYATYYYWQTEPGTNFRVNVSYKF